MRHLKLSARFGNNLVSQVLEPQLVITLKPAQDSDVIAFLTTRKERQESSAV
jgi:hypothetical protein